MKIRKHSKSTKVLPNMNFTDELNLSTDPWRVWWSWSCLSCSLWCLEGSCAPLASRTAFGLWSWGAQTSASGLPARCRTGSRTCSTDPGWIHSRPSARGSGLRSCPSRRSSSWTVPCAAGHTHKKNENNKNRKVCVYQSIIILMNKMPEGEFIVCSILP